ncbi:hypothetical protein LTR04_002722 [Oleoguttula sp. CCFEE 6159]|nr:hypothetical protein LTR04_002722 [Oleoguttula sp. CCFEE 6159]
MADQANARQQPTSYPSPHSYPSPLQQPAPYAYPPQQGSDTTGSYRASPTESNMSLPPINLPPLREGQVPQQAQQQPPAPPQQQQQQQQQQQHQQPVQQAMGSPLPPAVVPMSAYYQHPSQPLPLPNVTSSPHTIAMRYGLSPQGPDQRVMSGGRHKKEIKRRTKTGCLTCRKRRIKCDEAHPTCRNCQKSKRECLGYDPIFKQQPGPPSIQPAPSAGSYVRPEPATSQPGASAYSNVPQGYAPAASAGYSLGTSSTAVDSPFEYGSAIDPALAGADPSSIPIPSNPYDHSQPLQQVKPVDMDALFESSGVAPPPAPKREGTDPIPPDMITEIQKLFAKEYAPGLDKLFETTWYSTKGMTKLMNDNRACEVFEHMIGHFANTRSHNYEAMQMLPNIEARTIWSLMCLPRSTEPSSNEVNGHVEEDDQTKELLQRLDIFEHLLTNRYLDAAKVPPWPEFHAEMGQTKWIELQFWHLLGKFISLREDDASSAKDVDPTLIQTRGILNMLENRDVLYSIAVARYLGPRFPGFPEHLGQAYNNNPEDERTRLVIAKSFIEVEAAGKGTTQVIQRVCGMTLKSWILARLI